MKTVANGRWNCVLREERGTGREWEQDFMKVHFQKLATEELKIGFKNPVKCRKQWKILHIFNENAVFWNVSPFPKLIILINKDSTVL